MSQIINYDSQGWPLKKLTIREILESIGAIEINGILGFPNNSPILDIYPRTLEDDGMGYGVNEKKICEARAEKDYCNLFIEEELPNINDWEKGKFFYRAWVNYKGKSFLTDDIKILDNGKIQYKLVDPKRTIEVIANEEDLEWN